MAKIIYKPADPQKISEILPSSIGVKLECRCGTPFRLEADDEAGMLPASKGYRPIFSVHCPECQGIVTCVICG